MFAHVLKTGLTHAVHLGKFSVRPELVEGAPVTKLVVRQGSHEFIEGLTTNGLSEQHWGDPSMCCFYGTKIWVALEYIFCPWIAV